MIPLYRNALSLLLTLLIVLPGLTQPAERFVFTNYTMANGLPDNYIHSVMQDSRGFIWIGTKEGLSRFDGNHFRNFYSEKNNPSSLPGNSVSHLFECTGNELFFLADGIATLLNTQTKKAIIPPFARNRVYYKLTYDGKGTFGLSRPDTVFMVNQQMEVTDTITPPLELKGQVVEIYRITDRLWLTGSVREYYIYDREMKKYRSFLTGKDIRSRLPQYNFQYYDAQDKLFYFSNYFDGLFSYDETGQLVYNWKQDGSVYGLGNSNIAFMKKMNDSIFWLGTMGGGLNVLNKVNKHISKITNEANDPGSLAGNIVLSYCHSRDNNEWLATNLGVCKLNNASHIITSWKKEFSPYLPEKDHNLLNIVKVIDGRIYTGIYGNNKVFSVDPASNKLALLSQKDIPGLWCMNQLGNKLVFAGSGTRICLYDPVTGRFETSDFLKPYFPTSELVVLVFRTKNGDTWYSGNNGGGFVRVEASTGKVHHYTKDGPQGNFSISYYSAWTETANGDLWFGVNKSNRLLRWQQSTDRFTEYPLSEIKGANNAFFTGITDLCTDKTDRIWIALDGSGLAGFDWKSNTLTKYTIENGLPSNYLYALQSDHKGRLWIGTTKGISCLDPDKNRFTRFNREDGLPDDFFNERCILFDHETHKLWIGSTHTLMNFDPDSLLGIYRENIPVYIDDISVNGKIYYPGKGYKGLFKSDQNNIQFQFNGVDINNGKDLEFAYRLAGADPDWISNNTATTASYANLTPGDYRFYVRARHRGDTSWSSISTPFYFTIQTPWNKTWWFRLLLLSGLAFITTWLIRDFYRRKLEKEKAILENEQAIERERTRMARELHDGLGSMLSGIKHSFNALQNQLVLDPDQQSGFESNIIKLNESIRELRSITHSMASDSMLKYGLENSLKDYCKNLDQPGGLKILFTSVGTQQLQLKEDRAFHLFRIVQELLQNIIKHAAATEALVQLSSDGQKVQITVEDNGQGFETSGLHSRPGIGLKNVEARVQLLKGKYDFQSSPEKGTSVLIEVPLAG